MAARPWPGLLTRRRRRPAPRRPPSTDPVTRYARSVVAGKVVAGKLVRQACQRHLDDLKASRTTGLRFDARKAWRAITFFRTLRHIKVRKDYIHLEPWEEFIVGSLTGWVRPDGRRRFRDAYIEVARKNGKSTLLAGLMILLTFFDGEGGAEGYVAATKKAQAQIIFGDAKAMVRRCPTYKRRLKVLEYRISDPETSSTLLPLGADADTLDGLNPHVVAIDELHAHPTAAVLEVMESGQGSRAQPMVLKITTAGWNRNSVCWRQHERGVRVLDPQSDVDDDALFVFIASLDEGDDYRDEAVWAKANPNLDVSVNREFLRRDVKKATETPEELPNLLQKRFNKWVSNSIDHAINMELWDVEEVAAPIDLARLKGRACYGGLDLAPVKDLSSFGLIFPPIDEGERWKYYGRHFVPIDNIRERTVRDKVPYERWAAEGWIVPTEGNQTDWDAIVEEILRLAGEFRIQEIAEDPAFSAAVSPKLQRAGLTVVDVRMGYMGMTYPCNELLRLVHAKQLQHGGDPVLRWSADNLVMRSGPMKRLMPDKERSREKIDPMVALILAIGRATVAAPPIDGNLVEVIRWD